MSSICPLALPRQPITSVSTANARTTAPLSTPCVVSRTRSRAPWQPSCRTWTWPSVRPGETPGDALTTNARRPSKRATTKCGNKLMAEAFICVCVQVGGGPRLLWRSKANPSLQQRDSFAGRHGHDGLWLPHGYQQHVLKSDERLWIN